MEQQDTKASPAETPPSPKLRAPIPMSDALEELRGKSHLICPDTCVLLRMIEPYDLQVALFDKKFRDSENMRKCENLINKDSVGWIVTEQICRELEEDDAPNYYDVKKPKENITTNAAILASHSTLDDINWKYQQFSDELRELAEHNKRRIVENAIVLQETPDVVNAAWKLVRGNKFPNQQQRQQQMKDSVILSHLHECANKLKQKNIACTLYIWTFDTYGKSRATRFPHSDNPDLAYVNIERDISKIADKIAKGTQS